MQVLAYGATVPVFTRALENVREVMKRAQEHALANNYEDAALLHGRLAPDMLDFVSQVRLATDMPRNACARLVGEALVAIDDPDDSFESLHARIDRTILYMQGCDESRIEEGASRSISLATPQGAVEFSGADYVLKFVTPNLYFHASIAYAILRHAGLRLGKSDFLGPF